MSEPHLGGCWPQGDPYTIMPDVWERLIKEYGIKSVLDIGCGAGHSLKWFHEHGLDSQGIEGDTAAIEKQVSPPGLIKPHDFTKDYYGPMRDFDLGWCAEFVEHVEAKFAPNFLATFRHCKIVVITHAMPGQAGYHHVNCQPDGYWERLMDQWGFDHIKAETEKLRASAVTPVPWGRNSLMFFKRREGSVKTPAEPSQEVLDRISAVIPTLEGWASVEKGTSMARLITQERPMLIVEIGVFGGRSLIPMAIAADALCDRNLVVGIDPWTVDSAIEGEHASQEVEWWGKNVNLDAIHTGCMAAIRAARVNHRILIMRSTADRALAMFQERDNPTPIDLLHIDGNHSEAASTRDVLGYLPLVRKGGWIYFDDSDWASTQKAVALVDRQCDRMEVVGNCLLFRKL